MVAEKAETLKDRHRPEKSWGWEEWIVNNDLYCGKRLHFCTLGGHTSLHFHVKKHETMYAERGEFQIEMRDTTYGTSYTVTLEEGHSIVIPPATPHRITASKLGAFTEAVLVEFSTHHEDSDSYRIEK